MSTKSMKGLKRLATGIILAATPMLSFGASYGPAGCGLGAIVFDGQAGLVPNILAGTTNGLFGNASFGMTFGTLGCDVSVEVKSNAALFIDNNMESIAGDMARGEGESLLALADVLGITGEDQVQFFAVMKNNFHVIYANDSVTSTQVIDALVTVLKSDETLSKYVG